MWLQTLNSSWNDHNDTHRQTDKHMHTTHTRCVIEEHVVINQIGPAWLSSINSDHFYVWYSVVSVVVMTRAFASDYSIEKPECYELSYCGAINWVNLLQCGAVTDKCLHHQHHTHTYALCNVAHAEPKIDMHNIWWPARRHHAVCIQQHSDSKTWCFATIDAISKEREREKGNLLEPIRIMWCPLKTVVCGNCAIPVWT